MSAVTALSSDRAAEIPSVDRWATLVAHDVGPVGGMERQMARLATGLLDADWHVVVVARRCELPAHPRLHVVRVRGPRKPFAVAYPWFLVAGSLALSRHRRGVVHAMGAIVLNRVDIATVHFCHRAAHGTAAARRVARPGVFRQLSAVLVEPLKLTGERLLSRADRLVASSRGVARELAEHWGAAAVQVIPNGVDVATITPSREHRARTRAEWGLGDDDLVALFLGGDWKRKGLEACVEAVCAASRWHLVVVGPGDPNPYRADAIRHGALERVHFVGTTDDLPGAYAAADVFVLPSAYESSPLALYEAASAGLPLIVTRFNGAEDIVDDGVTGWFVERDGRDIGQRLEQLRDAPSTRNAMAERARAAALPFDWESIVNSYADLYESAVATSAAEAA